MSARAEPFAAINPSAEHKSVATHLLIGFLPWAVFFSGLYFKFNPTSVNPFDGNQSAAHSEEPRINTSLHFGKPIPAFPDQALELVTNRQLRVDAGACFGSVHSIDRGLDGEGAVLSRDGQADFHQVLAVVG